MERQPTNLDVFSDYSCPHNWLLAHHLLPSYSFLDNLGLCFTEELLGNHCFCLLHTYSSAHLFISNCALDFFPSGTVFT